jgi:hypothetical protein
MSATTWIASLFIFSAAVSGANVNLEGAIRSENNQGIPGARVSLKKHPAIAAVTGADGSFVLSGTAAAVAGAMIDTLVVIARG